MVHQRDHSLSHGDFVLSQRLTHRSYFIPKIMVYPLGCFSVLTVLGMHMCLLIEFVVADCAVKPRKVELICITIGRKGKPAYVPKVTGKDIILAKLYYILLGN